MGWHKHVSLALDSFLARSHLERQSLGRAQTVRVSDSSSSPGACVQAAQGEGHAVGLHGWACRLYKHSSPRPCQPRNHARLRWLSPVFDVAAPSYSCRSLDLWHSAATSAMFWQPLLSRSPFSFVLCRDSTDVQAVLKQQHLPCKQCGNSGTFLDGSMAFPGASSQKGGG